VGQACFVANNSGGPAFQTNTVRGVRPDGTNDVMTEETRTVLLPPTTQSFTYDDDGNLLTDGVWSYTWDAENRLIQMTNLTTVAAGARKKLEFAYDYRNRRTWKIISTWNGSNYVSQSTNKFIYDNWNLIAEVDHTNGAVRTLLWGSDLSGSMHGAGGVGGLVALAVTTNGTHFPAFDGNGNVATLFSASTAIRTAAYEFGAFGEVLRAEGSGASSNPVRFSSRYQDSETDLLYYGFRYYFADTGRWLSRDPIGALGGINPYCIVENSPNTFIDILGLCKKGDCQVRYIGSQSRRLAYFSLETFTGGSVGTPPQEILELIRDSTFEEWFSRLPREVFHVVADRVKTILTIDKSALLHWNFKYKATGLYDLRKCECKERNPWTLGFCCSKWGWSDTIKASIKLDADFPAEGQEFTPDPNNIKQVLVRSFLESAREGHSQFITSDNEWKDAFLEEFKKQMFKLHGCKTVEFVDESK